MLRGRADERLRWSGLVHTRTFGVLSEWPLSWIEALLRCCITAGWVDFADGPRPIVLLSAAGKEVMQGRRPARLRLPPRGGSERTGAEAATEGVPAYRVASDRTLREIAALMPQNEEELLSVHGIGEAKLARYGEGLLQVVAREAAAAGKRAVGAD